MPLTQALRPRSFVRHERRCYQRVRLALRGRFMLEDRREYPCQTADISPGGIALITPATGRIGERIIAYIDRVGRVEGTIVRTLEGGFAMTINGTPRKKDKLAAKLTWLANRHELNLPEDRPHDPVMPGNPYANITLPDGREYQARILDMSFSGAALGMEVQPPIGAPLMIGSLRSVVIRHIEEGVAVEFVSVQTPSSIAQGLS